MAEIEVTAELLNALGAKVEGLELTESEQAVIDAVLKRAESVGDGDDVEGFGVVLDGRVAFKGSDEELQVNETGRKLMRAVGLGLGLAHEHQNPYIGETEKNLP